VARGRSFQRGGARLAAPKRQIANDGLEMAFPALTTVIATNVKSAGTFGQLVIESAATLVRTRGEFLFTLTLSQALEKIQCAFGMIVTSSDALAAGTASLPGPLSDIENDWFVWEPFNFLPRTATEGENFITHTVRRTFDSRGMRKLKFGDALVPMVEFIGDVGGTVMTGSVSYRQQFKL